MVFSLARVRSFVQRWIVRRGGHPATVRRWLSMASLIVTSRLFQFEILTLEHMVVICLNSAAATLYVFCEHMWTRSLPFIMHSPL